MGFQLLLIGTMTAVLSPVVGLLLLLRSVPSAIEAPVLNSAVTPRLPQHLRATYLSLMSLAGRLGYAVLLLVLGASASHEVTWQSLHAVLVTAFCVSLLLTTLLLLTQRSARPSGANCDP